MCDVIMYFFNLKIGPIGAPGRVGPPGQSGRDGIPGINAWTFNNTKGEKQLILAPSIAGKFFVSLTQFALILRGEEGNHTQ